MNELTMHNDARRHEVMRLRDSIRKQRAESPVPGFGDYPLTRLQERITEVLRRLHGGWM